MEYDEGPSHQGKRLLARECGIFMSGTLAAYEVMTESICESCITHSVSYPNDMCAYFDSLVGGELLRDTGCAIPYSTGHKQCGLRAFLSVYHIS